MVGIYSPDSRQQLPLLRRSMPELQFCPGVLVQPALVLHQVQVALQGVPKVLLGELPFSRVHQQAASSWHKLARQQSPQQQRNTLQALRAVESPQDQPLQQQRCRESIL